MSSPSRVNITIDDGEIAALITMPACVRCVHVVKFLVWYTRA